jgi:coiled-coil domain-containing protein 12
LIYLNQELREKASKVGQLSTNDTNEANLTVTSLEDKEDEHQSKKLKFRNYQPRDRSLAPQMSQNSEESLKSESSALVNKVSENLIEEELKKVQSEEITIAPKKINADLKQQVASKIEKLHRRTQRAIIEILRKKLSMDSID